MHEEAHPGESATHIFRGHPIVRIIRVVIIAIYGKAVGAEEVLTVAIIVFIRGTSIIMLDRRFECFEVFYDVFVGV
jgi:hypothetical protein